MSARNIAPTLELKGIVAILTIALVTTAGVGGAALDVGPLGGQDTVVAQQENPLETAVSLEPSSATVTSGETTTYDVVVENVDGGVGAYDFTVGIADPSVASIADVAVGGNPSPQTTDVSIAGDGSSVDVLAALANTDDAGSVTIGTVTVRGDEAGTSDIELTVDALGTEAGQSYAVTETTGTSITVESDEQTPEPEPDPANFQVSNLNAPDSAIQGENVTVSADVTNGGEAEATQTVEFRVDADGDGTLDGDETLTSRDVTLDGGETQTVTFSDLDTSILASGEYTHGAFTDDDSATATITIEAADDGDDSDGDDGDNGDSDDGDDSDDDDGDDSDGDDGDDSDDDDGDDSDGDDGDDSDDGDSDDGDDSDEDDGDDGDETTRETAVSLQSSDSTVTSGETTTYDVVVENVDGGVGAYDFTVGIADPSVASIADIAVGGNPSDQTTDVSIADDESSVDVIAALADTDDAGSVTIGTVTVRGDDAGTSDVGLTVDALGTEAGQSYAVTETTGASIAVEAADEDPGTAPAPETAVRLQGASAIDQTQNATFNVVVENADGGVGAYDFTVTLDEWTAASIRDVSLRGNPSAETTDISIAEDGSSADVTAAMADTDDTGSVIIATVTVIPEDFGFVEMDLTVDALETEAGESYVVTETTGASTEVIQWDPEPAEFAVSNLDAPASATQGDAIDVSADVTNEKDEDGATKWVDFRLDLDGDGTLDADETLASQNLTLNDSQTKTVTFNGIDTSGLDPGEYTHGVVTEDDSATATITIEAVDDGDDGDGDDGDDGDGGDGDDGTGDGDDGDDGTGDGDDGDDGTGDGDDGDDGTGDGDDGDDGTGDGDGGDDGADDGDDDAADEEFTLDEVSQAKYGRDFAELSTETAAEVQEIFNRQPFPEGTDPADIRTRDEITTDRYDRDFDEVSRETAIEIQNDYDAQFGPLPSDPSVTLDEVSQAKYGQDFANLSTETAAEVQEIFNRQPFPEGTDPADIRTRDEIATDRYDHDFDEVSRETAIEIQNDYDAQFGAEN